VDKSTHTVFTSKINQYIAVLLAISLTVILCKPLANQQGYHIVSFVLLFVVSVMAVFLGIGPILVASTLSALVWNYLFIPPYFTFNIIKTEDKLMFGSFFFIAMLNGVLTNRIRRQERLAREREDRTNAIFELTKDLSNTSGVEEVVNVALKDVRKYFDIDSIFVLTEKGGTLEILNGTEVEDNASKVDLTLAEWAFKNSAKTGKYTNTGDEAPLTYYPLTKRRLSPGIIGVDFKKPLSNEQEIFWTACLTQISNALEREFLSELALKARLLDGSDKLYKTLFTLISHEFRIPIAAIMGASDTLLVSRATDENRNELFKEIFKASARLNHLIENLLNMSRLESGKISVRPDWCEINDLLNKVVQVLRQELEQFHLIVSIPEEMPLVRMDFGLMEQVIYNLILNSCQNSPVESTIIFEANYMEGCLIINIEDNGPGFPPELLDRVFDKFFRVDNLKTGGLGLGLSIVKGIVEAHKGIVKVENKKTGGARFVITIPSEIPDLKNINLE
jgi:two-component system sensor histidine kinase KdpD